MLIVEPGLDERSAGTKPSFRLDRCEHHTQEHDQYSKVILGQYLNREAGGFPTIAAPGGERRRNADQSEMTMTWTMRSTSFCSLSQKRPLPGHMVENEPFG
jgi:hypothetical protein